MISFNLHTLRPSFAIGFACTLLSTAAWAGRPLSVDDADVNEVGHGHVEMWFERTLGPSRSLIVAPAYSPIEGIEIAAAVARDTTASSTSMAVQAKWRITPVQESGRNFGASASLAKTRGESDNTTAVTGLMTCNVPIGAVNVNVGALRAAGVSTVATWGLSLSRAFGDITGHVEAFGQQQGKTTLQVGARYDIAKNIQLDGTVGRGDGQTLYSAGMKVGF